MKRVAILFLGIFLALSSSIAQTATDERLIWRKQRPAATPPPRPAPPVPSWLETKQPITTILKLLKR